jgi:type VI secretion system protein ImpH
LLIEQFSGAWLALDPENRTSLGRDRSNGELGIDTILGSKFWDQQAAFRLTIGPLSFEQFRELLPPGGGFGPLVELTRLFAGLALDFDVRLILKAAEVPVCRLGRPAPETPQLGWSSWLKTKDFTRDAADALLGRHLTRLRTNQESSAR